MALLDTINQINQHREKQERRRLNKQMRSDPATSMQGGMPPRLNREQLQKVFANLGDQWQKNRANHKKARERMMAMSQAGAQFDQSQTQAEQLPQAQAEQLPQAQAEQPLIMG